jgi:hypothetical protein
MLVTIKEVDPANILKKFTLELISQYEEVVEEY